MLSGGARRPEQRSDREANVLGHLLPREHQGGQVRVEEARNTKQGDKTPPDGLDGASATYLLFKGLRRIVSRAAFRLWV